MHKRFFYSGGLFLAAFLAATVVRAEEPQAASAATPASAAEVASPWQIDGEWSVDASTYHNDGDESTSPYNHTGPQYFSTLSGSVHKDFGAYEKFSARWLALLNKSDYRSPYDNLVLEQFSFSYENGAASIPYAVDGGDIYAAFSPRSLQVPLKGAMIELQPGGQGAWQHSITLLSGFDQSVYRDMDPDHSLYAGASWLMENEAYGSLLLNNVFNQRERTAAHGILNQNVTTLAGETDFHLGQQNLNFEAEAGALTGDWLDTGGVAHDGFGTGFFSRIEGNSKSPLDYNFSFERYGEAYAPAGAVITPNQSIAEANAGWRFDGGLRLSGRYLRTESDLQSGNPLLENTYGARLSGPLATATISGLNMTLDGSYSRLKDDLVTIESNTYNSSLNLSKTLSPSWTARYGGRYRRTRDEVTDNLAQAIDQNIALDYIWNLGGWSGTLSPGIAYIKSFDDSRSDRQIGPQFLGTATYGEHAFSAGYQFRQIDQRLPETNIFTDSASLRYVYTHEKHSVTLSGEYFGRDADGTDSKAYRAGLTYTLRFDNLPKAAAGTGDGTGTEDVLTSPHIGMSVADWRAALTAQHIATPPQAGKQQVILAQPFTRLTLRQKVVYRFDGDRLAKHAVVFEPESENPASLARDYQSALNEMIRYFGRPTLSQEKGQFSAALSEELASGQFQRLNEWNKGGRIVRFGIPRRLDNQIQFELDTASGFPAPNNPLWGIGD